MSPISTENSAPSRVNENGAVATSGAFHVRIGGNCEDAASAAEVDVFEGGLLVVVGRFVDEHHSVPRGVRI